MVNLENYFMAVKIMINPTTKCFSVLRISFALALLVSIGLIVYSLTTQKNKIKVAKTPKEKKSAEETYKTLMYSGLGLLGYSIIGFLILCVYVVIDINSKYVVKYNPSQSFNAYFSGDLKCY